MTRAIKKKTYTDFFLENWGALWGSSGRKKRAIIDLTDAMRATHTALYGKSGTGKSRLLEGMVASDISRRVIGASQRGICLIDPHGDAFDATFDRLALLLEHFPDLADLVYVIDPTRDWSVRFDLLEIKRLKTGETPEARAGQLATDLMYIFHDDPNINVRQFRVSKNLFLALSLGGYPISDAEFFLIDPEFRKDLTKRVRHPKLERYWLKIFSQYRDQASMTDSTLNRLDPLLSNPNLEFMFTGPSTIDFRELMDKGAIVLVNGRKDILGTRGSYLFCGMVLAKFQEAAMSRIDIPREARRPFAIFADEYQTYATDTSRQIITEDRKLGLEFVFATQDPLGQPENRELLKAIRKGVGNVISMRLDYEGAEALARDLFVSGLVQAKAYVEGKPVFLSLSELRELEVRNLTQLPNRWLYFKHAHYPVSAPMQTVTVKDIQQIKGYEKIPGLRCQLELAAFKLAGARKYPILPPPRAGTIPVEDTSNMPPRMSGLVDG